MLISHDSSKAGIFGQIPFPKIRTQDSQETRCGKRPSLVISYFNNANYRTTMESNGTQKIVLGNTNLNVYQELLVPECKRFH